jgi:hypothetical protein
MWKRVVALPIPVLEDFGYEPDLKRSGVGIEVKLRGTSFDHKLVMHTTLDSILQQLKVAQRIDTSGALESFLLAARDILLLVYEPARGYAELLEKTYELPGFTEQVLAEKRTWMLRYLYYPPGSVRPPGDLAKAHADKGGFTFDLLNGDGRFEYLAQTNPLEWKKLKARNHMLPVVAGVGLQELTGSRITAVAHRVVATDESYRHGRYAAVCFIDFLKRRHFNKALYGSQQEQPLGWNYEYSPEKFASYFID